jgi:dCMP deaminase
MKERYKKAHMTAAFVYAGLSHCIKRKVGCIVVNNDTIIAFGYNGRQANEDNCCEDEHGNSRDDVIHAEENAIRKLERDNVSASGSAIFITKIPCLKCAERIISSGITAVYYCEESRTARLEGMNRLQENGVYTEQITPSTIINLESYK